MKKIALFLVLTMLFSSLFFMEVFAEKEFSILIDGQKIVLNTTHTFKSGRTMVSLDSGIFEELGAKVRFDEVEGKVWIEGRYSTVELTLNESTAYIHRKYDFTGIPMTVKMDVAPFVQNGKVFIPLRFAVEGLDALVKWDGINNMVLILTKGTGDIIPVETPVAYTEVGLHDVPKDLTEWVEAKRMTQGIFFTTMDNKTYVLISAGQKPTGGYSIQLKSVTMVAPGSVYLSAQIISPAPDMMVTQALTFPIMLIAIDDLEIDKVEGTINGVAPEMSEDNLNFEVVDEKAIADNSELSAWVQKHRSFSGVAYTRIDEDIYVYVSDGEKSTGGYSIDVVSVMKTRPDEAFVNAVINSPAPDMMVIQVITWPYTVIQFKQGTIKHVDGEVKNTAIQENLPDAKLQINPDDITEMTLFNLSDEVVKTYTQEEYTAVEKAYNDAQIDNSFYILMITGNKLSITLKDGTTLNMTSYGSTTNIIAAMSSPDGKTASWHLVCPEIAEILLGVK